MPEYEAPTDGWLTVRVGGDRMTRVKVEAGETIELDLSE